MNGLLAKFATPDALVAALERLQRDGYTRLDAYTPYPLGEVISRLGGGTRSIGWIAALSAIAAGALTYAFIYWSAAVDYPLNVGGRPLHGGPAAVPTVLVAAALASGLATLVWMLRLAGLPRWHHSLFDARQFDRASYDRFFLHVAADDPYYAPERTRALLDALGAEHVDELRT